MNTPFFFDLIPPLRLVDPLAALLGAATDGLIEYRYVDAVKWAGHSCPTVAGAWLMTTLALRTLYGDRPPQRGGIKVELREAESAGTAGVVGGVIGLIVGAAGAGGFKGLSGRFGRAELLRYGAEIEAEVRFTRLDSQVSVSLDYNPAVVPFDPAMPAVMQRILGGQASAEDRAIFAQLWQDRVRRILLENADNPELVRIHP